MYRISNPANAAPKFGDQDPNTVGDQSDEATRSVPENTDEGTSMGAGNCQDASRRTDDTPFRLGPVLMRTRSVDQDNGQLRTKADLDYETKTTYTVVVTATDPSGASDSITVTINVTDEQ